MLKKYCLVVLLIASIAYSGDGKLKSACNDTLRIHPLGDSITRGKSGDCYRHYLRKRLKKEMNVEVDFVGSCPHAPDPNADWANYKAMADSLENDIEHDGWGGIKIHELTNSSTNSNYPVFTIEELVTNYPSDVILLMIGTNDIYNYYNVTTAPVRADTLIKRILRTTDTRLIVSSIPPVYSSIANTRIVTYNTKLDSLVGVYKAQGYNISFVDNYSGMDGKTDILTDDWVHPNSSGFKKIGNMFYEAVNSYYNKIEDDSDKSAIPANFKIYQNYPNPFNNDTNIRYYVPSSSYVNLKVYNILGEEVMTCFSGVQAPGDYILNLNGDDLSSGMYIYKLFSGDFCGTRKFTLVK